MAFVVASVVRCLPARTRRQILAVTPEPSSKQLTRIAALPLQPGDSMPQVTASSTQEHSTGRHHIRYPADFPVRLVLLGETKDIAGRSGDISLAGLCLYAPVKLEVGRLVRLQFSLPHSTYNLDVTAVVKEAEGFRYSVEFSRTTERDRTELERVCRILSLKAI